MRFIFGYKTIAKPSKELWDADFEVMLEVLNLNLDAVVVSATRWRQNSSNVPSKISLITQKRANLQKPANGCRFTRDFGKGLYSESQQGGGSPRSGDSRPIDVFTRLIWRMNNATFRKRKYSVNVINLDPLAIENAEVLLGLDQSFTAVMPLEEL
ncbi:MAG: hypothetical protein R3B93_08855 [Bacteroidia bacterium]